MQKSKESFLAFFSYAHSNDKHDKGKLTKLRKLLQNEIWDQTGKSFKIFQDVENIKWGEDWKECIKDALDASSLLLAIITPSYLVSQSCRFEFEYFLKRESLLNRKLILPILYIDTPKLNDKNDNISTEISKRQWVDWNDLRFSSLTSARVNKKLESLARQIRELIDETIFSGFNTKTENDYLLPESVIRENVVVQTVDGTFPSFAKLPVLYAPIAQLGDEAQLSKQITILLRPTGDRERDKRRIKILFSTLISFYGRDRFSFQFFENGKGHLLDFPKETTRVCPELLNRLIKIIGEESWRIEEITFQ
jgi:hypothetical protein